MLDAGHKFEGPDGQGYMLTRPVNVGDAFTPSMLAPYGGAPEPTAGTLMPSWLAKAISKVTA